MSWLDLSLWITVLKVAVGLGLVIFVHELGHFAVAKLCGVKCEKFYLGFDIAGLKLCKFTWGETEYGIGILPLGGYVKMLGQEDNPARLKEEIERAKQSGEAVVEDAKAALFDPRSYLAQSVPKRMAIISAGVVMNLIFAFLVACIAFGMGVKRMACGVGQIMPGEAAWQANLKVGDQIIEIDGEKTEKFRDMQEAISLGDNLQHGKTIVVRRPGVEKLLSFTVMPNSSGLLPKIGIANPQTTTISTRKLVTVPGSAAAKCKPPLEFGDRVVKIDDVPIESYAQLHAYLALHPEKTLAVTVERTVGAKHEGAHGTRQLTIDVAPNPTRRLGLVMEMGEVSAVQAQSPAAAAGIRPGDRIVNIDGKLPGDPMTLPERLRSRAGQTITLTIEREGEKQPIRVEVPLRRADWYETPMEAGNPMTTPALGIAYHVLSRVHATIEGSPAARHGLRTGDIIVEASIIPPDKHTCPKPPFPQKELTLRFDKEHRNWPALIYTLQETLPGTMVQLEWLRQKKEHSATLQPVDSADWFNPDRGLLFEPMYFYQTAGSFSEAIKLGARETINATLLVYRFLHKLGTQVSPRALGGPVAIFVVAKHAAEQSTAKLLIFLTLLSANLAVINFLPIPLLDGGHMVLLAWEGIRGKPADQRIQVVLTYIGLFFILGLMAWVIGLDIGLISRH